METLLQDFRYCLRQLVKAPGFALTALVSLAMGIGATTAIFSVIHAILLDPYPYAAPDRMVHMRLLDSAGHESAFGLTGGQWRIIRKSPVVEDSFATDGWSLTVTGSDLPEDVNGSYMTSNTFQFMGVPAALGRGLIPSDALDGQEPQPVVVLGYKFWQRHYSGDPSIVGKQIQLVRKPYTVVGVAAQRFTWDDGDVYVPLKITEDLTRSYYVGLRLKPGISHQTADAAIQPLLEQFAQQTPKNFPSGRFKLKVVGLNEDFEQRLGGTLYLLFGAVGFLLLIGCANVSILQLARGLARQHELSVRAAIGAARARLARQLLVEALIISMVGAALGVLLAYATISQIAELLPSNAFPHEAAIQVNTPVLLFSVALALLTGALSGLWPALQLSRPDVAYLMQSSARRVVGGSGERLTNNILIGGQIALTIVMLSAAGASMRNFIQLLHIRLGYDPHNIMSVRIPVHEGAYASYASRAVYFEQILKKISAVPGVTEAAISTNATPPANGWQTRIQVLGKEAKDEQKVRVNFVDPGYFSILRIALLQGRIWNAAENQNAAPLAVINQTMARQYFPDGALGHSLKVPDMRSQAPFVLTSSDEPQWLTVVGVIADKRDDGLRNPILPEFFLPYTLGLGMGTQILVRSNQSPLTLLHAIGKQVNSIDADQQIGGNVEDLEHWIQDQAEWQQGRLITWLFGLFAFLGLVLAAAGLYSVVSFATQRRTSEFGIRMALGAQKTDVIKMVMSSTVAAVGSGIGAGIVVTLALNRVLARWSDTSSLDGIALVCAVLLLCLVAALAAFAPASRASRVDPMTALRYE